MRLSPGRQQVAHLHSRLHSNLIAQRSNRHCNPSLVGITQPSVSAALQPLRAAPWALNQRSTFFGMGNSELDEALERADDSPTNAKLQAEAMAVWS